MSQFALALVLCFAEPGFPVIDTVLAAPPADAVVLQSVEELAKRLQPGAVLLWRHGSAFPTDLWPAFVAFLEAGGSFVSTGGAPFAVPVGGKPGARRIEARTTAMLRALGLNHAYPHRLAGRVERFAVPGVRLADRPLEGDGTVFILEPRLSSTKDFEHEDGAPGARDGAVEGLSRIILEGGDGRFPEASGIVAVERWRGRFAGGRWVMRLLTSEPRKAEVQAMIAHASRPVVELRIDPTYACYHAGEKPTVRVFAHRPNATSRRALEGRLELSPPGGAERRTYEVAFEFSMHGEATIVLEGATEPGLYRIRGEFSEGGPVETGFWIFDPELFTSGDEISFDGDSMLRNGRAEAVIGTTVMSASVHRKFLFEPNVAEQDETFAELASIGVNMVRTGVWSAWRKIALDPGAVDESWMRALEAYYLSARRHRIPVLFSFFAFLPETWGGENPYLSPRSIEAQSAWLASVSRRFAPAKEMLWDLINEPSFASAKQLWRCRPNGDTDEATAFRSWLRKRYSAPDAAGDDLTFEEDVRSRWRLLPGEAIGVPTLDDYEDRHVFEKHRPMRAREFSHFAQDAFESWIDRMTIALRDGGSKAAITVGQDEGGLYDRPGPLFHHRALDFTSMHTWWNNDAQMWDVLMAKGRGTPLLVSETGVMQRELLTGEALRTPDVSAALLERKLAYSFAGGAFGVIQWCYDTNPYMASDNEVAIGLRRVDGSYKPEHRVFREISGFFARHRDRYVRRPDPEIVVLVPHADSFSPRGLSVRSTQRAVRTLAQDLGLDVQAVSEYRTRTDLGHPRVIFLPTCRGISNDAWNDLLAAVEGGTTLVASGWFEADDAGRAAVRIGAKPRPLHRAEVYLAPFADADDPEARDEEDAVYEEVPVRFLDDVVQSLVAAEGEEPYAVMTHGAGKIVHVRVPFDLSESGDILSEVYGRALHDSGIEARAPWHGLTTAMRIGTDKILGIVINEFSVEERAGFEVSAEHDPVEITVPAGRARFVLIDAKTRRIVDATTNP